MSDFGVPGVVISIAATSVVRKVNDRVRALCKNSKFHFITHERITTDFLYRDGVHLADPGTEILAENI